MSAENSRAFVQLPERTTIVPTEGGYIRFGSDEILAPNLVACTPTGVGIGPLFVGVPEEAVCTVDDLTFLPGDAGSALPLLGLGVAAAPAPGETDAQPSVKRRTVLLMATAILASGAAAASSDEDLVALHIAEISVTKSTGPLLIRVIDVVDEVLPPTTEIMVDADGTRAGKIADPQEGVILPSSTTGTVKVYLRDAEDRLARLLAWAKGIVGGEDKVEFARELPQKASDYDQGEFVRLSSHPALVSPVEESGASKTRLYIGNTRIPYNSEADNPEPGSYGVFDGTLIYEVGERPPASDQWMLRTRLGLLASILHRLP